MACTTDIRKICVGSRKSELAMIQTNGMIERLKEFYPSMEFDITTMETIGDFVQDIPLSTIGQSNLFTKELEKALATAKVDMLVHSMKDLPSTLPDGMVIAAVCLPVLSVCEYSHRRGVGGYHRWYYTDGSSKDFRRDDPFDAVVLHSKHRGRTLSTLPEGSVIGTSSVRRIAQLKHEHKHLKFKDVRGNVNTRLRKLDKGDSYDALILAKAGMERMGWDHRISQVLNEDQHMYAVSQGALGVEVLESNAELIEVLSSLNHPETVLQCVAERALLRTLEGGCSAPVAVRTGITDQQIELTAASLSLDGSCMISETKQSTLPKELKCKYNKASPVVSSLVAPNISQDAMVAAERLGVSLAEDLLKKGADKLLAAAKEEIERRREEQNN